MTLQLLCTDLDRTLIPNGNQPESEGVRAILQHILQQQSIGLVYVTGRHLHLVEQAIEQYQLPQPDTVIADVGTTIYHSIEGQWQRDSRWTEIITEAWNGHSAPQIHRLVAHLRELSLQPAAQQGICKLSFHLAAEVNIQLLTSIAEILQQSAINANLVWSVDETTETGLLDIIPATASKLAAIRYLMQQKEYAPSQLLFSGDSGNDAEVLVSEIPAVLVANATDEVRTDVIAKSQQAATTDSLYVAIGGWQNTNGNYASGILEGINHFYPDILAQFVPQS